jgi:hypothetical protein
MLKSLESEINLIKNNIQSITKENYKEMVLVRRKISSMFF